MTAIDFAATFGIGIAIILAVAVFVFGPLRQEIRSAQLFGAILVLICYGASIAWIPDLVSWPDWMNKLSWNWTGKVISITTILALIAVWSGLV